MIWALVIMLAADPTPRLTWYETVEDCRAHAAVRAFQHTHRGAVIEWMGCQGVSRDRLRAVRVEVVPHEF